VWLLPDALEFVEAAIVAAVNFSSFRSSPGGRHPGEYFMEILTSNPQATNDAPATSNFQIRYKKSVQSICLRCFNLYFRCNLLYTSPLNAAGFMLFTSLKHLPGFPSRLTHAEVAVSEI